LTCAGAVGDATSFQPAISADGAFVAFASAAANLVTPDANPSFDVLVFDPGVAEPDASWANFGSGFPGTHGVPTLVASADPVFGTTITIETSNSLGARTVGLRFIGFSEATIPTTAGGTLLVQPLLLQLFMIAPIGNSIAVHVPRDDVLCGLAIFLQVLEADDGAAKNVSFTPGLRLAFGF